MEINTKAVVDTTAPQNESQAVPLVSNVDGKYEGGISNKPVPSSQNRGYGEINRSDRTDIDLSEMDIGDNFLDNFVSERLKVAKQEHGDKVNYDKSIIAACKREREEEEKLLDEFVGQSLSNVVQDLLTGLNDGRTMGNPINVSVDCTSVDKAEKGEAFPELIGESVVPKEYVDDETLLRDKPDIIRSRQEIPIDENVLDELIGQSLITVVRDLEAGSNGERVGTDRLVNIPSDPMSIVNIKEHRETLPMRVYSTDNIGQFPKRNVDCGKMEPVIPSGIKPESLVSVPKCEPGVLDRKYITQKPKPHTRIGTLNKILMRLGLKKKPRYPLQKSDISWPLPESLVIRGPDGELEDGLIAMYVGDLLSHIVSTPNDADTVKRSLVMPSSFSATSPGPDKTVKQIKSEGDISTHGVSLPSTKKSGKLIHRLFGDCGWSRKCRTNSNNADLDLIAVY